MNIEVYTIWYLLKKINVYYKKKAYEYQDKDFLFYFYFGNIFNYISLV